MDEAAAGISVPTRAQAQNTVFNLVLSNIVNELNLKLSSKQNISFLAPGASAQLVKALKGWNCSTKTETQPVTTEKSYSSLIHSSYLLSSFVSIPGFPPTSDGLNGPGVIGFNPLPEAPPFPTGDWLISGEVLWANPGGEFANYSAHVYGGENSALPYTGGEPQIISPYDPGYDFEPPLEGVTLQYLVDGNTRQPIWPSDPQTYLAWDSLSISPE